MVLDQMNMENFVGGYRANIIHKATGNKKNKPRSRNQG